MSSLNSMGLSSVHVVMGVWRGLGVWYMFWA